jgi:hypothetical protein
MADTPGDRISAAGQQLCRQLTAALGKPASTDPGRVDRGGAWVRPKSAKPSNMAGDWTVRFDVFLVAADTDEPTARKRLTASLDKVLPVVDLVDEDDEAIDLASALALPNSPTTRLPAFRLLVEVDTEDNEEESTEP